MVAPQGEEEEGKTPKEDVALENTRKRKAPSLEDGEQDTKRPHMSDAVLEV